MPPRNHAPKPKEPLILWWMPVVALLAPVVYAAWQGASAGSDGMAAALTTLLWPGVLLYGGTLAVLWGGWKIDLE
jgi:hypothetical protein